MATTRTYLDYLNEKIDISPANSQEELDAAELLGSLMEEHGLDVEMQDFDAPAQGKLSHNILYVVMFLGMVLAGFLGTIVGVIGLVLVLISFVLLVLEYAGHDVLGNLGPRARSQNVIGVHRATGPNVQKGARPIVIVAHYDSPNEDLLSRPQFAHYKPALARATFVCSVVVPICALFQLLGFLPYGIRHIFWFVGIIASLPLLAVGISAIYQRFAPCTFGANDNKSSVAAMLGVMDMVRPHDDVAKRYVAMHPHASRQEQVPEEAPQGEEYAEQYADEQYAGENPEQAYPEAVPQYENQPQYADEYQQYPVDQEAGQPQPGEQNLAPEADYGEQYGEQFDQQAAEPAPADAADQDVPPTQLYPQPQPAPARDGAQEPLAADESQQEQKPANPVTSFFRNVASTIGARVSQRHQQEEIPPETIPYDYSQGDAAGDVADESGAGEADFQNVASSDEPAALAANNGTREFNPDEAQSVHDVHSRSAAIDNSVPAIDPNQKLFDGNVRRGSDFVSGLNILPKDCEIVYQNPPIPRPDLSDLPEIPDIPDFDAEFAHKYEDAPTDESTNKSGIESDIWNADASQTAEEDVTFKPGVSADVEQTKARRFWVPGVSGKTEDENPYMEPAPQEPAVPVDYIHYVTYAEQYPVVEEYEVLEDQEPEPPVETKARHTHGPAHAATESEPTAEDTQAGQWTAEVEPSDEGTSANEATEPTSAEKPKFKFPRFKRAKKDERKDADASGSTDSTAEDIPTFDADDDNGFVGYHTEESRSRLIDLPEIEPHYERIDHTVPEVIYEDEVTEYSETSDEPSVGTADTATTAEDAHSNNDVADQTLEAEPLVQDGTTQEQQPIDEASHETAAQPEAESTPEAAAEPENTPEPEPETESVDEPEPEPVYEEPASDAETPDAPQYDEPEPAGEEADQTAEQTGPIEIPIDEPAADVEVEPEPESADEYDAVEPQQKQGFGARMRASWNNFKSRFQSRKVQPDDTYDTYGQVDHTAEFETQPAQPEQEASSASLDNTADMPDVSVQDEPAAEPESSESTTATGSSEPTAQAPGSQKPADEYDARYVNPVEQEGFLADDSIIVDDYEVIDDAQSTIPEPTIKRDHNDSLDATGSLDSTACLQRVNPPVLKEEYVDDVESMPNPGDTAPTNAIEKDEDAQPAEKAEPAPEPEVAPEPEPQPEPDESEQAAASATDDTAPDMPSVESAHTEEAPEAEPTQQDTSGLGMPVEEESPAENIPQPRPIDDPNWGRSEFRPAYNNVARRAVLFDLPNPTESSVDPFATDPQAKQIPAQAAPASPTEPQQSSDSATASQDQSATDVPRGTREPLGMVTANRMMESDASRVNRAQKRVHRTPQQQSKGHRKKFSSLFNHKTKSPHRRQDEPESMGEWLGVGDDFDAKTDGRKIGSWDNFEKDDQPNGQSSNHPNGNQDGSQGSRGSNWKGGATTRSGFRVVQGDGEQNPDSQDAQYQDAQQPEQPQQAEGYDLYDQEEYAQQYADRPYADQPYADPQYQDADQQPMAPAPGADASQPMQEPTPEDLRGAILGMGDNDLIAHDIYFVALGASGLDHAGMRNFLAEHRSDIRGAFLVNLDCVGSGELTFLAHEGRINTRRSDRRMGRMLMNIAKDLHIHLGRTKYDWDETDGTPAMQHSVRVTTLMGVSEDGVPALSATADDVPENVNPGQVVAVADLIAELIRRS